MNHPCDTTAKICPNENISIINQVKVTLSQS